MSSESTSTNPGNFANRPTEEVQAIASKGGQASHSGGFASMDPEKQREIASKGGQASGGGIANDENRNNAAENPGNFANRPREEVQAIASKGGQASHAHNVGFAAMDPEKQKEIASMGGKASHGGQSSAEDDTANDGAGEGRRVDGTFTKGSEAAKEAGHKGGLANAST